MERKRLVADRFQRIWQIVEFIGNQPGCSRRELAERFSLSERQVQADLNVVRGEMGLVLVRRRGYRFLPPEEQPGSSLDQREAQLLLLIVRNAMQDPTLPAADVRKLALKLPALFPPHLTPLVVHMTQTAAPGRKSKQAFFETIVRAILKGNIVRLHYPRHETSVPIQTPDVRPYALFPYQESWYLIGHCKQRNRLMMFDLETVDGITDGF
ncbi:MAG: WYL domain-containing protein [Chloroflexi bacterium]|nr:WYL domain-containing protein [Chloroflexota bacterium]